MPTMDIEALFRAPDNENDDEIICGPNFLLLVVAAEVRAPYSLQVTFNDGTQKQVNVLPLLWGSVFKPLLDQDYFARMRLTASGVVAWPNGANLAPEALYQLPNEPYQMTQDSYAYA